MTKWVYNFGKSGTDGDTSMRNLLGGKGANLAEMSGIGLPVPPGFTISTDVCTYFYDNGRNYPTRLMQRCGRPLPKSRVKPAVVLLTQKIRCLSRCGRARGHPCRE
jgi:phosphoenolpyruvate synthase/pyruvate phosphate dikinase